MMSASHAPEETRPLSTKVVTENVRQDRQREAPTMTLPVRHEQHWV